jgi:hypothetical protein
MLDTVHHMAITGASRSARRARAAWTVDRGRPIRGYVRTCRVVLHGAVESDRGICVAVSRLASLWKACELHGKLRSRHVLLL